MPKFKIKVTQVYRTEKVIELEVEDEDLEMAIENVASGNIDLPDSDDPRWLTGWDLQSEEVTGDGH